MRKWFLLGMGAALLVVGLIWVGLEVRTLRAQAQAGAIAFNELADLAKKLGVTENQRLADALLERLPQK